MASMYSAFRMMRRSRSSVKLVPDSASLRCSVRFGSPISSAISWIDRCRSFAPTRSFAALAIVTRNSDKNVSPIKSPTSDSAYYILILHGCRYPPDVNCPDGAVSRLGHDNLSLPLWCRLVVVVGSVNE